MHPIDQRAAEHAGPPAQRDELRRRIDELDAAVLRLLGERRELSRRVQNARVAAGGVRIELDRERQIIDTYREALGPPGVPLATALLRVCRGPG